MGKSSKRVLFFPWDVSGGFGYTGRCLAAAEILRAEAYDCVFSATDTASVIEQAGFKTVGTCKHDGSSGKNARIPSYLAFANLDQVFAVVSRYYRKDLIEKQLRADLAAIQDARPGIVVTNMQPTAAIAARVLSLPLVSLADADFLSPRANSWMPWIDADQANIYPYPACLPAFNDVLGDLSLGGIDSVSDLMWGDRTVLPSIPELEPVDSIPHGRANPFYVGPMFWDPPWSDTEALLDDRKRDSSNRRIFVTVGSGVMCQPGILQAIIDACDQPGLEVLISTGYLFGGDVQIPSNVVLRSFTGLAAALRWSDLVISHGGYSTVLASLLFGKPSIIIPFMSEQEANGLYFIEQPNAGLLLRRASIDPQSRRLVFHLRSSGHASSTEVPVLDIREAITEVLTHTEYRGAAKRLSLQLEKQMKSVSLLQVFDNL